MKKIFLFPILVFIFACSIFLTPLARAHEIIPADLQTYLSEHPEATPQEIQGFFAAASSTADLAEAVATTEQGTLATVLGFIPLGITHVLGGTDHVLFIISLLLVFVSFKEILKMTGAFTVAHSTTLIASTLLSASLSSRIVEPLIAFSIAYVALTTVFLKKYDFFNGKHSKIVTVFFFGLFHGLGFAGVLGELHIPANAFLSALIAFNIGIEFGQLIVIAAALPILYLLRNKRWYPVFIKIIAVAIAAIALFWAVERIITL